MSTLRITFDPALRPDGLHSLRSEYVETFWLPKIGPTAISFLRSMGLAYAPIEHICHAPTVGMPFGELSSALGLTKRIKPSKNHRLIRMFVRLEHLHLAELPQGFRDRPTFDPDAPISIRLAPFFPTLHPRQVALLPVSIQALHALELAKRD